MRTPFSPATARADGSPAGGLLSHLAPPTTLRAAFGRGCDVTGVPRKSLLRLLAEHCADEAEKRCVGGSSSLPGL